MEILMQLEASDVEDVGNCKIVRQRMCAGGRSDFKCTYMEVEESEVVFFIMDVEELD
jgi:hypothetical protein